jgi:hypothetical protein
VGTDYPAACDGGPATDGKGNIYSPDGKTWKKLYRAETPDEFNYNFIVTAVISSLKGDLPGEPSTAGSPGIVGVGLRHSSPGLDLRSSVIGNPASEEVSTRSSLPASFPEIANFILYRSKSYYKNIPPTLSTYVDNQLSNYEYYQISALYSSNVESEKSNVANISVVDIKNINDSVDIFPTLFGNNVYVKGYEYTSRIDVVSVNGKICLGKSRPGQYLDTSSLSPGVYFFRFFDDNNKLMHVVRTIKVRD